MKHHYSYDDADLLLRPLEEKDIESLRLLRNRPENRIWFFGSGLITKEEQKAWFERYLTKENDYMFSVYLPEQPNEFIGAVAIYGYESDTDSFEVGRLLLDSANLPKRGMGTELVGCVCELAREVWGNIGLRAQVFSDNERSLRCFLKNGFEINDTLAEKEKEIILLSRRICK